MKASTFGILVIAGLIYLALSPAKQEKDVTPE
jgi:hypothetical protein